MEKFVFSLLCFSFLFITNAKNVDEEFHEELMIRTLDSGHIYAHFQFTTLWNIDVESGSSFNHFNLFPKSLGEILHKYSVKELHLSMTQGLWRHEKWRYPIVDAPPGAELWAWFLPKTKKVDETWKDLVNSLSGQFCASLNFMDSKSTVTPKWTFRPFGTTSNRQRSRKDLLRYSALPREPVCSENLTPWKKLLPCSSKAGLATLLNAIKLFDTSYHSQGIHVAPVCKDKECKSTALELTQTLTVVFEPGAKNFGKLDWNMRSIFGKFLGSSCPIATSSKIYVDVTQFENTNGFELTPTPSNYLNVTDLKARRSYAVYSVPELLSRENLINIGVKYGSYAKPSIIKTPPLRVHRFATGYGQESGGIKCLFANNQNHNITVIYMETVPWYFRVYLHTLKLEINTLELQPDKIHYVPGRDRDQMHLIEIIFNLPAKSTASVSFEFENAIMQWTEYPPDANHGFYINSAVVTTQLHSGKYSVASPLMSPMMKRFTEEKKNFFLRLHTESLLVTLPTPDFSMPYNVICLACTVVAIAFGSIHNLSTKRFVILDQEESQGIFAKIKSKLFKKKDVKEKESDKNQTNEKIVSESQFKFKKS